MLVVAADTQALRSVIESVPQEPVVAVAATASRAREAATAQRFHTILIDLRDADAALMLAIPRLVECRATDNLVVIAPQALAEEVGSHTGVDAVIVAPFSTKALIETLKLDDDASTDMSTVLRFHKPDDTPEATKVLFFPEQGDALSLPQGVAAVDTATTRPDIIVLTRPDAFGGLHNHLPRSVTAITPIVDLTGSFAAHADISLDAASYRALEDAFATLKPMVERARALPAEIFLGDRDDDILLARLYVRGRGIEPVYTSETRDVVAYRDSHVVTDLHRTAQGLTASGALKRVFFDKVNCCHECGSARVMLREECRKCRSSDVEEVSVIHHFRCGYQAPERDFIDGNGLRCPKCMFQLEAFSVDYDRPGSLMMCSSCGNETGDPAVGFHCLDCGTNADAAQLVAKPHHGYELTEKSRSVLVNNCSARAPAAEPGDSPQAVISTFIIAMEQQSRGYSAMLVRIDRDGAVRREHGERAIRISLQLLSRAFHEALMPEIEIVRFDSSLVVLLPHGDAAELRQAMPELLAYARGAVALPLELESDIISGHRLKEIVFDPSKRRGRQ